MTRKITYKNVLSILFTSIFYLWYMFANQAAIDPIFETGMPVWFDNMVRDIAIQNDDKIVVGGQFTTYKGVSANRIIRLNDDWSKDPLFDIWEWFNNNVRTFKIQNDGKILVWGDFTQYKWSSASRITRINTDWSRDSSYDVWARCNGRVENIALQDDGKIIIWGKFTSYKWSAVSRLVRVDSGWVIDSSFNIGDGFNNTVQRIAIQTDWKIIVAGEFTSYNWVSINRIIRLNTDGSIDNSFVVWNWFDGTLEALNIQSDWKIVIWGQFISYNGTSINRIVRLNSDGSVDGSFDIGAWFNNTIKSIYIYKMIIN